MPPTPATPYAAPTAPGSDAVPPPPPPPPPPPGAYPAPPAYPGQTAYGVPARPTTNGMAVASLVLGIAGFALCLVVIGPVLALVFGYKGRRQIDESNGMQTGRGMATAGIVLGWVGVGLTVMWVALIIIGAATGPSS